jgi:hypothetical protein
MGRNAKFYKSTKSKKQQSSIQADVTRPQGLASSNFKGKARASDEDDTTGGKPSAPLQQQSKASPQPSASTTRLKSKLWQSLDSKRDKEGKRKFATPGEAGIDYLGQWEGRRPKK